MEDSGVTSFSSSGSVDLSLDALDISNPNELSAATCSDSTLLIESHPAAVKVETASTPTHSPNEPGAISPVQAEGELQR